MKEKGGSLEGIFPFKMTHKPRTHTPPSSNCSLSPSLPPTLPPLLPSLPTLISISSTPSFNSRVAYLARSRSMIYKGGREGGREGGIREGGRCVVS
jgi:hypothetical protein